MIEAEDARTVRGRTPTPSDDSPRRSEIFADPSDIRAGDWVERWLPAGIRPYARLARLDRPIGTWLLLFPGWWGIALASRHWPDPVLMALFAVGAVVMRGAGCTLNDIADRDYDRQVARTRLRPLASGARQRAAGRRFSDRAIGGRRGGAVQPEPHQHFVGICGTRPDRDLSVYEAGHLLAAGFSRPQFQLGCARWLDRRYRQARLALSSFVRGGRVLDDRLRHDLRASGQG